MTQTAQQPSYAKSTFKLHPAASAGGALLVPSPWRVSAIAASDTVIDTTAAWIAFPPGSPAASWLLPVSDFAPGALDTIATTSEENEFGRYRCADLVRVDGRRERVVRIYDELNVATGMKAPGAQLASVAWDAVDAWMEEGQRMYGHPRSPFHRVDVHPTRRRVVAQHGGRQLVDSTRAQMLVETLMSPRLYVPWDDVDSSMLEPSETRTWCPYKGEAHYFDVVVDGERARDAIWYYPFPYAAAAQVQDHLCVWPGRVDELLVDGTPAT